MLISKTICHQGLVREKNEDSYISNQDDNIWLVADGVGGNESGEFASQLAVQTVERKLRQGKSLISAIQDANNAILSAVMQQADLKGMATTIIGAKFEQHAYQLAWVGDSRAYLIRPNEDIKRITYDHNVAQELFDSGEISEQEMLTHDGQHELTQAIGQMSLLDIPALKGQLSNGSILLLCTDGLSGVLSENEIFGFVSASESLDGIAENLLDKVLTAGAPDNITFTLIQAHIEDSSNTQTVSNDIRINRPNMLNQAPITWFILSFVLIILLITLFIG